jgi:hypothetical protein
MHFSSTWTECKLEDTEKFLLEKRKTQSRSLQTAKVGGPGHSLNVGHLVKETMGFVEGLDP